MRQTTTAEVRLDHENAAGSGLTGEQSGGLALNQVDRDRISLRRNLQGRRIRSNGPRIWGMSAELVDPGETGLIVRPGDDTALAGAIQSLLNNPELISQMAATAFSRVDRFKATAVVSRIEQVYESIVLERALS